VPTPQLRSQLQTVPPETGIPISPTRLHISLVKPHECDVPVSDAEHLKTMNYARRRMASRIDSLHLAGLQLPSRESVLKRCSRKFFGIYVDPPAAFVEARGVCVEVLWQELGVSIDPEMEEPHVSLFERTVDSPDHLKRSMPYVGVVIGGAATVLTRAVYREDADVLAMYRQAATMLGQQSMPR